MTTETQEVATTPETQTNALDTTDKPEIVEPGSTDTEGQKTDVSEEAKSEKTAEQKELERLRRQVTKSHRTQGRMHQETVELRERLAQLEQKQAGATDGEQTKAEIDPVKLAREIATIERVTEKANAVAKDGNKRFTDFKDALSTLIEEAGALFTPKGLPTPIGEAILEADDPAALIRFLGVNDELASELEGLSPAALGRRIAKFELQMSAEPKAKPLSKASEPINPLKGTANAAVKSLEQMSQAEYEAYRKKQGARWAR
jgi:phage shock protein A